MFLNQITYPAFNVNMGLDVIKTLIIIYQALKPPLTNLYPCTWVLIYILHFGFQAKPGSTSSLVMLSWLSQAGAQDLATPTPCALLWCLELNLMNCTPHPQPPVCFHMQTLCQLFSLQWRYSSPKNRLPCLNSHQSLFIPLENYFHQHCTVCVYSDLFISWDIMEFHYFSLYVLIFVVFLVEND